MTYSKKPPLSAAQQAVRNRAALREKLTRTTRSLHNLAEQMERSGDVSDKLSDLKVGVLETAEWLVETSAELGLDSPMPLVKL